MSLRHWWWCASVGVDSADATGLVVVVVVQLSISAMLLADAVVCMTEKKIMEASLARRSGS